MRADEGGSVLRRVDIEGVVVGEGPIASLVILRTREAGGSDETLQLPIRIGTVEATAITMGVGNRPSGRPLTHDLLRASIEALGARLSCVRITAVEGTTFFAQLELVRPDGERALVDARPSDAIALAVRMDAPIFAEDSVLSTAALPDFRGVEKDERRHEMEEFHNFVESLSPEDFNVPHGEQDGE